jgi:glycosyltransferase involved in cell wall biosynthesis
MMRILNVIPAVAPRYGGPSAAIWPLVSTLNQTPDVQAEIATTDADGVGGRLTANDLPTGGKVHVFRRNWSEQWKVSIGLWRWLRRHTVEYDLIHIHAVWSFATAASAQAAEKGGVPYIVRPAGMLSGYSWNHRGWKKRLYWQLAEHHTIQGAAGFHVTSRQEANEVRALRAYAPLRVIPNGVDEAAFAQPRSAAALRTRCGGAAGHLPIVLFLSRLHPKKGIVDLLLPAIAAMHTPCFLAIAGGVDAHSPHYRLEVAQAIERLGLHGRTALLGSVATDDRWAMFDGADVFVLPSHHENFGIVVAEAMARGCPVVVTDTVQSCEHVQAAMSGEVVPSNVTALAAALDRIVAEPQLRRAYGEAGREYATQHFQWKKIAKHVRQMYEECLERPTNQWPRQTFEHNVR